MRFLALLLILATPAARADVRPHALFGDNMVLQCDAAVPVWGTAEPGEEVTVAIDGQTKKATAGPDGSWRVKLDPLKAGGPHELAIGKVALKNVMAGEVWVCSGQSNMEWPLRASADAALEIAGANFPQIRLFTVPRRTVDAPQREVAGAWKVCSPETVPGFSAVAYQFGRELGQKLQVPVGLIHTSWGGTAAELWTSRRALESDPELAGLIEGYEKRREAAAKAAARHKAEVEKAKAEGKPAPKAPPGAGMAPSSLYNGMIAPIVPYAIRGAIWYQGESNASRARQYQKLFPAMIRNWRDDWGQGDFPFLFVQLANFMARKAEPSESAWAELREAQLLTLGVPRTGMAVIIDIGDAKDIHPKNKQDVGRRLAAWALHDPYGREVVPSGPLFESMTVEGNRARLTFKHVGGGLAARGEKLTGFSVAGPDKKFVWAEAKVDGPTVLVWSDRVERPAAVRYAWADNPDCNLYNQEGLPASPFRTDR